MATPTDDELWRRVSQDDQDAFAVLFDRHYGVVYRFAFRRTGDWSLAEEVASAAFLELWRTRRRARREPGAVRPWLLGITTNLSRNATRSLRRYRAVFDRIPPLRPEEDFADDLTERLDAQAKADAFRAAIARLPRRERDALALECEGLTPTEIAVALQTKATNVRVRLFRARRRLTDGQPRAMPDTHVPTRGAETP